MFEQDQEMDLQSLPDTAALAVLLELDQSDLEDLLASGCAPKIVETPHVLQELYQKHKFPRCDTLGHLKHCLGRSPEDLQRFALRQKDYDYLLDSQLTEYLYIIPRLIIHGQEELLVRIITNKHTEEDRALLCDYIDGKIKASQAPHLQLECYLLALLTGKRINARAIIRCGGNLRLITATAAVLGQTKLCLEILKGIEFGGFVCRWALKANQMETFTTCLPHCMYHPEDLFRRAVKYGRLEAIPILTQNLYDRCTKSMQEEAEKKGNAETLAFVNNWKW